MTGEKGDGSESVAVDMSAVIYLVAGRQGKCFAGASGVERVSRPITSLEIETVCAQVYCTVQAPDCTHVSNDLRGGTARAPLAVPALADRSPRTRLVPRFRRIYPLIINDASA